MTAQPEDEKMPEAKGPPAAPEAQKNPPSDVTHKPEYSEKYQDDVRSKKIYAARFAARQLFLPASACFFKRLPLSHSVLISPALSAGI